MKCPKCHFDNPEKAKFCNQCGCELNVSCSACNSANPPASRFCNECGSNLTSPADHPPTELSTDEKIDRIQRYLPKGLADKILSQKDRIEGERKQVTVMFCDLEGFTRISEQLGPEKMYGIMDQVYEVLIHKVQDFEGTVNEMTGDGIMALFGAPIALEDAPQRAIRSGMAIHREMTKLSDNHRDENIGPLRMRIGIHTGPVVIGALGNDLRVEFKAVGDTVNLASRLEELADPGTTYVSADTFKLTEGLFRFEGLGEKQIKGRKDSVKTYRVIATSSRRTRFDVSTERGLTPYVGRERELELLLDGFERSKTGRGQAFSIMAEAGLGKSRLLYEFRKGVANEEVSFYEGKCLSYSRGVAYHPIIDILKSNFNVLDTDDCTTIKAKVTRWLNTVDVDETNVLPYVFELLSVKDSGIDQIDMSPEAKKERILSAVNLIAVKGSEIRPLVIAIEDLHWIDKGSQDFLKLLLESISGARIFLVFTYRPEYLHTWGGKSYHSQINLNRLSNRESLTMVSHMLGAAEIDEAIETLVLEKTEGVPFFIEEFLKSLIDLKVIEVSKKQYHLVKDIKDVAIPSTIHEIIMTRVDSLPDDAKELLQIGSVIGREFNFELIKMVVGHSERKLLSRLSVLKDTELLYECGIYPQSNYIFKHALTQEVVYDSILDKRKKIIHDKIGRIFEELSKENIDEQCEVLCNHFIKAERYEKGEKYCKLICKKAVKKVSFNDAINYGEKRVECLERLPRTEEVQKKIIDARTLLGFYFLQTVFYKEAKEAATPVVELALQYDYKERLCQLHTIEGVYSAFIEEKQSKAFDDLNRAIREAKEVENYYALITARSFLGNAMGLNCEFVKALENLQIAAETLENINSKWGMAMNKSSQCFFVYNLCGKTNLALKMSTDAVQLAEDSGDIYSKAHAFTSHGRSLYQKGFLNDAERFLVEGSKFCSRIELFGWETVAQWTLGDVYYEIGDYEKSKACYLSAASHLNEIKFLPSFMNANRIAAARSMVMNNEKDVDLLAIYKYIHENRIKAYDGFMRNYLGKILLHIGEEPRNEAEEWIRHAIEADQRNGMEFCLAQDYALYADLFIKRNNIKKATEQLSKSIEIFKECGADGWVKKTEKRVATIS